jgi:hypothetical protein
VNNDLNHWLDYFKGEEIRLNFQRAGKLRKTTLQPAGNESWYKRYQVTESKDKTADQQRNFEAWLAT